MRFDNHYSHGILQGISDVCGRVFCCLLIRENCKIREKKDRRYPRREADGFCGGVPLNGCWCRTR